MTEANKITLEMDEEALECLRMALMGQLAEAMSGNTPEKVDTVFSVIYAMAKAIEPRELLLLLGKLQQANGLQKPK